MKTTSILLVMILGAALTQESSFAGPTGELLTENRHAIVHRISISGSLVGLHHGDVIHGSLPPLHPPRFGSFAEPLFRQRRTHGFNAPIITGLANVTGRMAAINGTGMKRNR
jgi:hypothetical protein